MKREGERKTNREQTDRWMGKGRERRERERRGRREKQKTGRD
jgi:hypothetical protein